MGGLPVGTTLEEVMAVLRVFDKVNWIYLPRYKHTGLIRGYAKAQLATQQGYDTLIRQQFVWIRNVYVAIQVWENQTEYLINKDQQAKRKIFVRLNPKLNECNLRYHFERFGAVESVDLRRDPISGRPRNIAYVIFEQEDAAYNATLSQKQICQGVTLMCQKATPYFLTSKADLLNSGLRSGLASEIAIRSVEDIKRPIDSSKTLN